MTSSTPASSALPSSLGQEAWRRLRQNKAAMLGLVLLSLMILACVFGPYFSRWELDSVDFESFSGSPPSLAAHHWLGTDTSGRDVLTRTLYGGRISLAVALIASFVSLVIGVTYGAIAGYFGGRLDTLMMRFVDILFSLPFMFIVILLMVAFGRNILLIFAAIGAVEWLDMARIVRGQVISLKHREFVEAAHALGASNTSIIKRHMIPNTLGSVIVYITLTVPRVILMESFLSFLGLGVQEPNTSWGGAISEGCTAMETMPWILIVPSVFLAITLFSLNFLGDGLRDALDPKTR